MNSISSSNYNSQENEEEDEKGQSHKTSSNDFNSIQYEDEINYTDKETVYVNEYNNNASNNFYYFENKKPKNILDYVNVNSDEYKKYKMSQKIKLMLHKLPNFPKCYIDEICNLSWFYSKKLSRKRLSTIVPIIVYKIITKYNINYISLKDLKDKINFRYKSYFKNEKLFTELNTNLTKIQKDKVLSDIKTGIIKNQKYSELVYNSVKNYIKKIKEKGQTQRNIIKIRSQKINHNKSRSKNIIENKDKNNKIIESLFNQLSNEDKELEELYYSPFNSELNNCQDQCKILIYNNNIIFSDNNIKQNNNKIISLKEEEEEEIKLSGENNFIDYFKNKICSDILGLGMIKYFIDKNKIIILSYRILKEIFNCNINKVKKSILYIKLYIKLINEN